MSPNILLKMVFDYPRSSPTRRGASQQSLNNDNEISKHANLETPWKSDKPSVWVSRMPLTFFIQQIAPKQNRSPANQTILNMKKRASKSGRESSNQLFDNFHKDA